MSSWAEFQGMEPEFAARVRGLLTRRKHLTLATLRRDGGPRISGIEIEFEQGELRIGSMVGAVKALDLRRDPRLAIHGPSSDPPPEKPGSWEGEAKLTGRAMEVSSDAGSHRFSVDIETATVTRLNDAGDRLLIESWSPRRGRWDIERT